jgi:hypothetical protein
MISFGALLASEVRRCLARRAVRVLVAVACVGIVATGIIAYFAVNPDDVAGSIDPSIARLSDLWRDDGDGVLIVPIAFLCIGALIGGAVVVGGEWKAGTVSTLATWEVRRLRLMGARFLACALVAPAIALALLVAFVAATLPTVAAHGNFDGLDGDWLMRVSGAVGRGLVLVAISAIFGAAIANLGRSSTPALAAIFVYEAILEPIARSVWPERAGWLLGENVAIWLSGDTLENVEFERGPTVAIVTLLFYIGVLAWGSLTMFARRDLAGVG